MNDYDERIRLLKEDLKSEIDAISCDFIEFKPDIGSNIWFLDDNGLNERKIGIDCISSENGFAVIYPRSKLRPPHSIETIENIYDLLLILKLIQNEVSTNL